MFYNVTITDAMRANALEFQKTRNFMKSALLFHRLSFDKFTCTQRDSFDGYLAEHCVSLYLTSLGKTVSTWDSVFPLSQSILQKLNNPSAFTSDEIIELKNHFYDHWDVSVNSLKIDIKTAATHNTPNPNWTYGIPEIQINKPGKDLILLAYLIYDSNPKVSSSAKPISCQIIGYKSISDIKSNYQVKTHNTFAGFKYHIPNYELPIKDFSDINTL